MLKFPKKDFLLISLLQDMKYLDDILQHILTSVKKIGFKSWLFPQKGIDECKDYYSTYKTKKITYEECLEMILEKLYVMFNFLNHQKVHEKSKRNIQYPSKITLGRCIQIFWESAYPEKDESTISLSNSTENSVINRESQTDNRNLSKCDSCSEIDLFVKSMKRFFSDNFEHSSTRNVMVAMNENIFSTTKFGGTLKFIQSIQQDYSNLVNELKEKTNENNKLIRELVEYNMKIHKKELQTREMDVLKHQLDKNLDDAKGEIMFLSNKIEIMKETEERLQQSSKCFDSSLKNLRDQIEKMQEERVHNREISESNERQYEEKLRNLKARGDTYQLMKNKLQSEMNDLKTKYGELFCKYSKICGTNKRLEQNLEDATNTMKNIDILTDKTGTTVKNILDRCTVLEEKFKQLRKSYGEEKTYTHNFSKLQRNIIGILQRNKKERSENGEIDIQGNPLIDLKRQMEKNEETIQKLRVENEKFASIVKVYENSFNAK